MKKIRLVCTAILSLVLILSVLTGTAAPVYAAETDMGNYLMKILGISSSEMSSYSTDYKNSVPIEYEQTSDSCYVALGGITASGTAVIDSYENGYTDQVAAKLNIDYSPAANSAGLAAVDAKNYLYTAIDRYTPAPSTLIPNADLITFQLDGAAFITSSMNAIASNTAIPWSDYINDTKLLADINNICAEITAEYAAEYGEKNAKSIAMVLEYMLYECVVYCHETMNVVDEIRTMNKDAVVLIVGLYNPLRGLSFTANGKTIDISGMVDDMIDVCNAYLLKHTKKLSKTAFIDVSAASTNKYSNVVLNINDPDSLTGDLMDIKDDVNKQYANQTGHNYIRDQILASLKAPCKHTKSTVINKKDATCTENGYTGDTVCADCGKVQEKGTSITKLGHSLGDWTQTKAPTCTEKGAESRSCTRKGCSHSEKRDIDATGHKWDKGTVAKEPTCTVEGEKVYTCSNCKKTKSEAIATVEHTYGAGVVTKKPTCKSEGTKTYTCKTCPKTKTESIAKVDHAWDTGVVTKEPTCKKEGTKTYTCATCNKTQTETLDKLAHAWDDGVVTKEPTCKKEGTKTYTCATCNKTQTETLDKLPHAWDDGVVTKEPDCNGEGIKTYTCATCGKTSTEPLAQLTHVWDAGVVTKEPDCNNEGETTFTCTLCSAVQTEPIPVTEHEWGEGVVTKEPDCKNEGEQTFTCSICSGTKTEVIPMMEHTWDDGVVKTEPDCENDGEKTTTCTICGDTLTEALPATGHSFGAYTSNADATCQNDGTKTAECEICGAKDTVADPNTRTEHVYTDGVCSVCGAEEPAQPSNSTVWIIVGCAAVVVLGGGAAGFWFFKKKKAVK